MSNSKKKGKQASKGKPWLFRIVFFLLQGREGFVVLKRTKTLVVINLYQKNYVYIKFGHQQPRKVYMAVERGRQGWGAGSLEPQKST